MQATHAIPQSGIHEEHHEDAGFWRTYIFSTDHKVIGIQYGVTALCFLFFGFLLMLMMRWQIAHPAQPVPLVGPLLKKCSAALPARGKSAPTCIIPSAPCTEPSWCSLPSCRWRSRRSEITS